MDSDKWEIERIKNALQRISESEQRNKMNKGVGERYESDPPEFIAQQNARLRAHFQARLDKIGKV